MAMTSQEKRDGSLEAERAVIGAMLIEPGIVRDVVGKVAAEDFLHPTNRLIFQTARALFRAGEPVDGITIRGRIGQQYSDYLVQMMEITPTAANWTEYADLMHEQTTLARIRALADKLTAAVTLEDCRPVCADLGQLLADGRKVDAWNMREMLDDFFSSQDPDAPAPEYITTGIREIDEGSFTERGDVVMIGGYPSDGKTALALMFAYHMAADHKVGFFSLETSKQKVRDRMVSHVAQVDFNDIKRRSLKDEDWTALASKSSDWAKRDLTVLRASCMTATEIEAVSQAYGFEIIYIDYIQLVQPETDRRAPRSEQMADVSRSLHAWAQKSQTLVVELAQLTRQERSGGWREPDMHDLKETGQFEQDADIIFLIYRPNPKSEDLDQEKNRILSIAKNKEYRRGKWPLYFDGARQTFSIGVGDDGKTVLRQLVSAGKQAKAKARAEARGQQTMAEFQELPASEAKDVPF